MDRPMVAVWSADPLTTEGITAMLGTDENLDPIPIDRMAWADVVVIAGPRVEPDVTGLINRVHLRSSARIVLAVDDLTDTDLRLAMTRPVMAVLPRSTATRATLIDTVHAVHANHALPRLFDQVEHVGIDRLRPRGGSSPMLEGREQEILLLLAEGCYTTEIAKRVAYSERTVKNIIRQISDRFGSHNRAHAVAFAIREGLI